MVCTTDLFTYMNQTGGEITSFLSYPNVCDPYFYIKILAALFVIIALGILKLESERESRPDYISIFGVTSLAIFFLATIMTSLTMLTAENFILVMIFCIIFVVIWLVKRR